jgi:DTW domain-containing protein
MSATEPIENRLFILILQHPQEKKETLATATATCTVLRRASLVIGLSWPNLARALGRPAHPRRWGVLYLGSARPSSFGLDQEIIALDRRGEPAADQQAMLRGLEGVVLLDGSWSEAKTLWWRNPWLLKLRRIVLSPPHGSRFGRFRHEPRREALSTIEAAALLLKHLDSAEVEAVLLRELERLLAEARPARRTRERVSA